MYYFKSGSPISKLCFVGIILFLSLFIQASETKINEKVKGIWFGSNEWDIPAHKLNATWIWNDESLEAKAILVRKTFSLWKLPEKAILRITASSQYQLYVNGQYVCRGPARCAPHHQSYDILDITGLLITGKNLLAIRVHHQDGKRSYQYEGRAGLQAQLSLENGITRTIYGSNSSWKVTTDPSWDNNAPVISRFQQVVNDRVDFREYQNGWVETDFDDSKWQKATPLMRNVGWPSPEKNAKAQALTPPWTSLIPRDIPYMIEKNIRAANLIEAIQIKDEPFKSIALTGQIDEVFTKDLNNYQSAKSPLIIPASDSPKTWFLLFDFGEIKNGMPKLDIQGTEGTIIDIVCAPFIVDEKFTHKIVDSELLDKIVLSGKRDNWEATYFKPTRYLGLVIRSGKEPLKIYSAGIHQIQYPFKEDGLMKSDDASWVENYFDATAKTINVCTIDAFTDNYRERRQYAQAGYYGALGNYWIFGDYSLQRRYLVQVSQEQQANGIMPAYAPAAGNDYMVIMDSNCLWIRSLRNYLLYSGDKHTVKELLPAAKKLMALLHSYTNSLRMIDNPPYAYWLDHALNDRQGANFNLNGHYLGALEDFAQVLDWLNESGGDEFQARAKELRQSLQTHLWDNEKQLFADALIDGKRSDMFSEHANAMALAMNVATTEQAKKVAEQLLAKDNHNFIKRESGITTVTPAMSYFLHKGLCNYGFIDESFVMFCLRFDKMLDSKTNGTLWEEWWRDAMGRTGKLQKGRTRSDAQTETAFPPALFAEYLLGVQPTQPGMKEIEISRCSTELKNIESKIPTPEGILQVKWNFNKNGGELKLDIPGEMTVKLNLESLGVKEGKQIVLNGKTLDSNLQSEPFLKLSKGKQNIEF
ncbi:MAG: alpha-L-rhamnosidase N-terminal domain-containing protein [Bacteroidetes bacterium]|nr:alpha-L-rhamnosidase N-terminal domain-containing protein [Bacteroidota bacterium]